LVASLGKDDEHGQELYDYFLQREIAKLAQENKIDVYEDSNLGQISFFYPEDPDAGEVGDEYPMFAGSLPLDSEKEEIYERLKELIQHNM